MGAAEEMVGTAGGVPFTSMGSVVMAVGATEAMVGTAAAVFSRDTIAFAAERLPQFPSFPGRQFMHGFPAFTQGATRTGARSVALSYLARHVTTPSPSKLS